MELAPLSDDLIRFIDLVALGDGSARALWHRIRDFVLSGLEVHAEYFLGAEEHALFCDLLTSIEEMELLLGDRGLEPGERAVQMGLLAFRLGSQLNTFVDNRLRGQFVPELLGLDALLQAGSALLRDWGTPEAVWRRSSLALEQVRDQWEDYQRIRRELPAPVQEALLQGFYLAECGFRDLDRWSQTGAAADLESSLKALHSGGLLLAWLVRRAAAHQERGPLRELFPGGASLEELRGVLATLRPFALPAEARELDTALEAVAEADSDTERERAAIGLEQVMQRLDFQLPSFSQCMVSQFLVLIALDRLPRCMAEELVRELARSSRPEVREAVACLVEGDLGRALQCLRDAEHLEFVA